MRRTNPKKVMGRRMLTPAERAMGVPYEKSAAWLTRKENIAKRVAYQHAVPAKRRREARRENWLRDRKAAERRKLAKVSSK